MLFEFVIVPVDAVYSSGIDLFREQYRGFTAERSQAGMENNVDEDP